MIKDYIKLTIEDCYKLNTDYQNQFLGNEVFPEPHYEKVLLSERTVNKIRYKNVYILEPNHYYYVTFQEDIYDKNFYIMNKAVFMNGLMGQLGEDKVFLYNASQNMVYLQKGTKIGEVL